MVVETTKLKTVKSFATDLGRRDRNQAYTPSYLYRLFDPENMHPAAIDLRQEFQLIEIDGVKFVMTREEGKPRRKKIKA